MTAPSIDRIVATFPTPELAASLDARTIAGLLVPWDTLGHTSAGPTIFAAGSVTVPDPVHAVKLIGAHRSVENPLGEAVGYLVTAEATDDGLHGTFKVPPGPAGDAALADAAGMLRDGLSVEVTVLAGDHLADGTLFVAASDLAAVAQVPLPAFSPARVHTVTASAVPTNHPGEPAMTNPDPNTAAPVATADPPATIEPEPRPTPTAAALVGTAASPTVAAAAAIPTTGRTPAGGGLTLSGIASMVAATYRGELSGAQVQAALDQSTSSMFDTPAAWSAELTGLVRIGRPLVSVLRSAPLPPKGMTVTHPSWKTLPTVDVQDPELEEVSSAAAEIEMATANVVTIAGANELSVQAVDRTDPDAVEALIRAYAELYARKVDVAVATTLLAAGTLNEVPTSGLDVAETVAAMLGGLSATGTPGGGLFLAVSWDVYCASFVGLKAADMPAWWDGSVVMGAPGEATASATGITVVVDPLLPASTWLAGARNGATFQENPNAPAQMRAVEVSVLGVDVGVYGYHALHVDYPGAFVQADTTTAPT